MKQHFLFFSALLFLNTLVLGQNISIIYYNKNWKGCSKQEAAYYRVVNYNTTGKPIGNIIDFYITGEMQGKADKAIYIDKNDDAKSIFDGQVLTYYITGQLKSEILYDDGVDLGSKSWYFNGNIETEKIVGKIPSEYTYNTYYENTWAALENSREFSNGKPKNQFYKHCDESGNCEEVFIEEFKDDSNLSIKSSSKSVIIPKQGLSMKTSDEGLGQWIELPIDFTDEYAIETKVKFVSGETKLGYGLIWGFSNWKNYSYFYIRADGYYKIGVMKEGTGHIIVDWTKTDYINTGNAENVLRIIKIDGKIKFALNNNYVNELNFESTSGSSLGFELNSGPIGVIFEYLYIKQGKRIL